MCGGHDISHSLQTTEPGYFGLLSATEVSLPLGFGSIVAADNLNSDRGDDCLAIVAAFDRPCPRHLEGKAHVMRHLPIARLGAALAAACLMTTPFAWSQTPIPGAATAAPTG